MRRELASSQPFMHAGHSCGSAVRGAFAAQVGRIPLPTSSSLYALMLFAHRRTVASRSRSFAGLRSGVRCLPVYNRGFVRNLRACTMCVRHKGNKRASICGVIAIIITVIIIITAYPFLQVLCSCVLSATAHHTCRWLR